MYSKRQLETNYLIGAKIRVEHMFHKAAHSKPATLTKFQQSRKNLWGIDLGMTEVMDKAGKLKTAMTARKKARTVGAKPQEDDKGKQHDERASEDNDGRGEKPQPESDEQPDPMKELEDLLDAAGRQKPRFKPLPEEQVPDDRESVLEFQRLLLQIQQQADQRAASNNAGLIPAVPGCPQPAASNQEGGRQEPSAWEEVSRVWESARSHAAALGESWLPR